MTYFTAKTMSGYPTYAKHIIEATSSLSGKRDAHDFPLYTEGISLCGRKVRCDGNTPFSGQRDLCTQCARKADREKKGS